jgi:uncharacterized membrane protein YccC
MGIGDRLRAYRPYLRFCLRVTVAGLAAFAVTRIFHFPLQGLWAVLTAIVVSQVSVGGSLRATLEYNIGTIGGAAYAVLIGLAVPHSTAIEQAVALAIAVAPLAAAAAINPSFRVAPFSAVLVLLIGSELGESPIVSAATRVLEVAIGGAVAVVVSLVVFPQRAHTLGRQAACRCLDQMAELLPKLLAALSRDVDRGRLTEAQNEVGAAVTAFQTLAEETRRERALSLSRDPDPAPLSRALLRLRHDLVIISRATHGPFPEAIARRLEPLLKRFSDEATAFLRSAGVAIARRRPPPDLAPVEAALSAYGAEIAAIRNDGLERAMETEDVERFFALGFALEQLCRDLADLAPRIREIARGDGSRPA